MNVIKCKECGKELSDKAEICPNCGIRVKKKGFIHKAFRFFEIVGVLIVVGLICFLAYDLIVRFNNNQRRKSYVGTWKLTSDIKTVKYTKIIDPIENYTIDYTILVDKQLTFLNEKVFYGIGGSISCGIDEHLTERCEMSQPTLLLNRNDKIVAIDFITETGESIYLCFKNEDKKTIKQVSCKGANPSGYSEGLYSANGGLDEDFDIVYKKVK